MQLLWMLLPDEALPLVFAAGALLFILGFRRTATSSIVTALMIPVIAPFLESLMDVVPAWLAFGVMIVLGFMMLRLLAALLLGQRGADFFIATLAADLVRALVFGLVLLPVKIGRLAFAVAARLRGVTAQGPGRRSTA